MSNNEKTSAEKIAEEVLRGEAEVNVSLSDVVQTTEALRATQAMANLQRKQTEFLRKVRSEKKITMSIAPQYAAEFSNNLPIIINGIRVNIPVDGRDYAVPQSFADEAKRRIAQVNKKHNRFKKTSGENVVMISEKSIGEVKLS